MHVHMYICAYIHVYLLSVPDAARASLAMSGKLKVRKMYEAVEENLVPSPDNFTRILVG